MSKDELREAMRYWATGVTVVTAISEGVRHGMTVSSFTSVSLDPPLILVCLERNARTRQLVLDSAAFAVNVLGADQEEISNRFAGRISDLEDRFVDLPTHELESGSPLLHGALAWFDCRVSAVFEMATHTIIVGHVIGVKATKESVDEPQPLLYFNRSYRFLQDTK